MKIPVLSLIIIILAGCSSSITIKYFDENNQAISKSKFRNKEKSLNYFSIPGDSINQLKLIDREQNGHLNNRNLLIAFLNQKLNLRVDPSKPLVILYYPGKDTCNSSGSSTDKNQ